VCGSSEGEKCPEAYHEDVAEEIEEHDDDHQGAHSFDTWVAGRVKLKEIECRIDFVLIFSSLASIEFDLCVANEQRQVIQGKQSLYKYLKEVKPLVMIWSQNEY
jgi:hypothetical protein